MDPGAQRKTHISTSHPVLRQWQNQDPSPGLLLPSLAHHAYCFSLPCPQIADVVPGQGRGEQAYGGGVWGGRGAGRAKPASSRNPVCLWSTNSQTTSGCNMTHAQLKGRRQFYLTYPGCLNIALSISLPRKMHTSGDLLSSASAKGRGDGPGWDPNSQSDPGQGSLCSLSLDSLKQRGD